MINLIKNELTKIFKKKSMYIIFIITIAFIILNNAMNVFFGNSSFEIFDDMNIQYYKEELSNLDINNPEQKYEYVEYKSLIGTSELIKKYGNESWQAYIIERDLQSIIYSMLMQEVGEEYEENYKEKYEYLIGKLDLDDWRYFAKEELKQINEEIDMQIQMGAKEEDLETLKINKQVINWRLEKNINYGKSDLNNYLDLWQSSKENANQYEKMKKTNVLKYSEEVDYREQLETISICEYAINNNINEKMNNNGSTSMQYSLKSNAKTEFLDCFDTYSLFIIIVVVMTAGTIISEEFNKGTIKLLLVRPYKRTKILISKFITCIIILLLTFMLIAIMQFIVGGIAYGFKSYFSNTVIYNFNKNSIEQISLLKYIILIAITKMPIYILIMTLSFTIGTLFTNSPLAIAFPLLGFMSSNIINQLAYAFEQAKFLMYFVTPNWDLSIFLFGRLPYFEPISMPFSLTVCIIYFIIMAIISILTFHNKNIKNI